MLLCPKRPRGRTASRLLRGWPRLEPVRTGIAGRCPRCGKGHLFAGFLALRGACEECGLDYGFADPADGPAFFVICFGCIPSVIVSLGLQIAYDPPFWVHLVVSLPFLLLTCLLPLRPLKGWLVCSQYFYKAREGRLAAPWQPFAGQPVVPVRPSGA